MVIFNVLNGFVFGVNAFENEGSPSTLNVVTTDGIAILIDIVLFALLYIKSANNYLLNCLLVYLISEVFCYSITYLIAGELFLSPTFLKDIVELALTIYVASLIGSKLIKHRRYNTI